MDSFGVMSLPNESIRMPFSKRRNLTMLSSSIRYARGRLIVAGEGDYRVFVTTPHGKTIACFTGRGKQRFTLAQPGIANGVYIAVLRSTRGRTAQRFLVSN